MKVAWPGSGALSLAEDAESFDSYYYLGLTIFALTVVGYTVIGGFLAAVWTDLFQSVMMLALASGRSRAGIAGGGEPHGA
jgi:SSS family solute:Na+ symporter/sodium/pantothenate symporter